MNAHPAELAMNKTPELPAPGDLFQGKYRIQKLLGKGGMGAVFSADHEGLGQRVAVKFLLAEAAGNEEANARFKQEARAAAQIQNDHVARVVDVSTDGGLPYMVMEYLDGQDLSQLLEARNTIPPEEACSFLLQAADAIHAAHKAGIIHRDLKPSNLFLAQRSDGTRIVKVLDFGISKAQNSLGPMSGALTSTKAMLGSPLYMSPEQLRSSKSVDARADIWALGVILYELITGAVPYHGDNLGELFAAILEQDPTPVRQRSPHVAPELEAVIMKCLQRQAAARYSSVAELALQLAPFAPAYSHLSVVTAARAQLQAGGFPASPLPNAGYTQPISQAGYLPPQAQHMGAQQVQQAQPQHPQHGYAQYGQPPQPQQGFRPPQASVPAFMPNTGAGMGMGGPPQGHPHATAALGSGGFVQAPTGYSGAEFMPAEASGGGSVAGVPQKSGSGLLIGIGAFVLVVAIGIGAYTMTKKPSSAGTSPSATATVSQVASPPPPASASATTAQVTPPPASATETAPPPTVAQVTPPPPQNLGGGHSVKPPPVASAKKPVPSAAVTPPPPIAATTTPTAKPTSTLQTSR